MQRVEQSGALPVRLGRFAVWGKHIHDNGHENLQCSGVFGAAVDIERVNLKACHAINPAPRREREGLVFRPKRAYTVLRISPTKYAPKVSSRATRAVISERVTND
jgi:hypothetical protein